MIVGTGRLVLVLLFGSALQLNTIQAMGANEIWVLASPGIYIESDIHDYNNEDNEIGGNIGTII